MESEGEHKSMNFINPPLSLRISVKLGWTWDTMQRDMERFCSEEAGKLVEQLVVDEFSEAILDLCDVVCDNTIVEGV